MSRENARTGSSKWLGLVTFIAVCLAIAAIGGAVTAKSVGTWYQTLKRPEIAPPDWLFAPVWIVLYITIAVAGWRVWLARGRAGTRTAMAVYSAQLGLNLAWSFVFFGCHMIGVAFAEILVLLAAISINAVLFWRIDRVAGWLLAPYTAWVAFASVLNLALWHLNRGTGTPW
ncbi:MAG: tryptophan-rich sensory protein [Proteobacteria bacterium]|nr:tryptophan-rich sensory protein [Pseudomonadota bacterium]